MRTGPQRWIRVGGTDIPRATYPTARQRRQGFGRDAPPSARVAAQASHGRDRRAAAAHCQSRCPDGAAGPPCAPRRRPTPERSHGLPHRLPDHRPRRRGAGRGAGPHDGGGHARRRARRPGPRPARLEAAARRRAPARTGPVPRRLRRRAGGDHRLAAAASMDGDRGDGAGRAPQRSRPRGDMSAQSAPVALITGASQGIGASLVAAYRKLGYAVLGTSRTTAPSDDPLIVVVQGDIAVAETAERVVDEAIDRFGRVDTLVNNAGVFLAKRFTDYTCEDYDLVTGVNLAGFFHITRRAIPHMV